MADNVTIDNGGLADFDAATDDVAGKHYQYVKLVDGTLDSTTKIAGDANGLWVNVKTIAAGQKIQLTDGTSDATVRNLAANDALNVAIVDGAGNQVTSFGGSGGTSSTDNSAFTPGTTADTPVAGLYQSSPSAVTDGRSAAIGIDSSRRVRVSVDASALDVAHDAVDSGAPVKVGSKAVNALPTAVANNDRVNAIGDLFGRLLVGHIAPEMQVHKNKTYTATQTGSAIWDPTAGKKIAVTSLVIGTYGTTAGRIIIWFGDNADVTFTQDTDQVLFAASFAPSSTSKPGAVYTPATPIYCTTADREIHVTTDAAISFDLTIDGYEFS
jgi:hypothetical protein